MASFAGERGWEGAGVDCVGDLEMGGLFPQDVGGDLFTVECIAVVAVKEAWGGGGAGAFNAESDGVMVGSLLFMFTVGIVQTEWVRMMMVADLEMIYPLSSERSGEPAPPKGGVFFACGAWCFLPLYHRLQERNGKT